MPVFRVPYSFGVDSMLPTSYSNSSWRETLARVGLSSLKRHKAWKIYEWSIARILSDKSFLEKGFATNCTPSSSTPLCPITLEV